MKNIYICNLSSNYISKINLRDESRENIEILDKKEPIGIHGITIRNDKIYLASNLTDSFYEYSIKNNKTKSHFIGAKTNDLCFIGRYIYLIGTDNNCIMMYDISNDKICCEIKCGDYPHSITFNNKLKILCVTNMYNNELTIIDHDLKGIINKVRTKDYPSNSKFYGNTKHIFVCESNLGSYMRGTFGVYDSYTGKIEKSITLDDSPIDMFIDYDLKIVFVSNYLGGCVSLIDIKSFKEINRIFILGMPRGIYREGRFLYIVLNDKNKLLIYDMITKSERFINLGSDPTCMYVS